MKLKDKIADMINGCVHGGQLGTALSYANRAAQNNLITHNEHIFLSELVEYREHTLRTQLEAFESNSKLLQTNLVPQMISIESDGTATQ